MNGFLGTAGHCKLVALAVAAAGESSLCKSVRSSPTTSSQAKLNGAKAGESDRRPDTAGATQSEAVPGATATDLKKLTKAICAGDEAAFTQFYDRYSLRLYRHLLVLARGNEGDAREVFQTAILKIAKGLKPFDDERRMWGWMRTLARNAYVDYCRTRLRDLRLLPLEECNVELAEDRSVEHRLSESLQHALEQLTAEERELMGAAYVDKRPLQELAQAAGQSYKAVESRLARLRRKLKTNLLNHLRHEEAS